MLTTEGIVIRERSFGEQNKFIDVLTKEAGVIEIAVKGAKKINGKSGSSTQLFAYSRFCCTERGSNYILSSAEPIHIFYGLRSEFSSIALACYFADVIKSCITEERNKPDIMRLFLNCLSYLENHSRPEAMLKSIFELRLLADIGFMPDVVGCCRCGAFEPDDIYFDIYGGAFVCPECINEISTDNMRHISLSVLKAIRHIVLSDFDRLFNFRIADGTQAVLSAVSEEYLLAQLDRQFHTLNYYRTLLKNNPV